MMAKATTKDNFVLLMFDEIVMARDEEDGIKQYVRSLIPDDSRPDILEIGFGMGISAGFIHKAGCSSHAVIEANADVMKTLVDWRVNMSNVSSCIVKPMFGFWEDIIPILGSEAFDGMMYDPHPSVATVRFLSEARRVLRPGGRLMFFISNYKNSSVPQTWRRVKQNLQAAGWQENEIEKPKLSYGSVMADCGSKYTVPHPTPQCPFRPITYIIPQVRKQASVHSTGADL